MLFLCTYNKKLNFEQIDLLIKSKSLLISGENQYFDWTLITMSDKQDEKMDKAEKIKKPEKSEKNKLKKTSTKTKIQTKVSVVKTPSEKAKSIFDEINESLNIAGNWVTPIKWDPEVHEILLDMLDENGLDYDVISGQQLAVYCC